MIPAPPAPFPDVNRLTLPAATELHRIHAHQFDGNAFNPCMGQSSRFAPLRLTDNTCIPTAYAAATLECAAHETVFHEIDVAGPSDDRNVELDILETLAYSVLRTRRPLVLVALFEPDLNKWGLTRQSLIDTFAVDYADTARWALAIHEAHPDVEGLVWRSRRCDPDRAYVLFGDRVHPGDLEARHRQRLHESNDLLLQIRAFAARAGILISS
jgi:hypothetical protein